MVAGVAGRRFLIEMAAKSSAEAHSAVFDMGLALCHGSTGGLERFERDLLRAIDAAQFHREHSPGLSAGRPAPRKAAIAPA